MMAGRAFVSLLLGGSIKISEAYGRGDYEAVRTRVATVYAMAVVVSVAVAAGLIPFAEGFLRLLKTPENLIAAGAGYFRVEILTLGINSATIALLLGYGYTKLTLLLNVSRVFLYRVPVLWAFQQFTTLGAEAVGMTMMISNVCTGVTAIAVAIPVIARIRRMKNK